MTICSRDDMPSDKPEIDLDGPNGNAFVLLAFAKQWATQLGKDPDPILDDMKSNNYEHLVEVLEREFGDYVTFYR